MVGRDRPVRRSAAGLVVLDQALSAEDVIGPEQVAARTADDGVGPGELNHHQVHLPRLAAVLAAGQVEAVPRVGTVPWVIARLTLKAPAMRHGHYGVDVEAQMLGTHSLHRA